MSRKTKEDAEKTRARVLASALGLFSKKGYDNTTFTDIAARLKMTKGAVYWHFPSKEALLVELVRMALENFRKQIAESMPQGELTFVKVGEIMVQNAVDIVSDPRRADFFRLMKCQIRWGDKTMKEIRERLLSDLDYGPRETFRRAIVNDIKAGRARKVDALEVASVAMALWDGLVQTRLDNFLGCDLKLTLGHSYDALWNAIRSQSQKGQK